MWTLLIFAAMAADPTASLTWKGDDVRLIAEAGPGEHVNDEGPVTVSATWSDRVMQYEGDGTELIAGLGLPGARGQAVVAQVELQVCTDDKSQCRTHSLHVQGAVPADQRKGSRVLINAEPPAHGSPEHGYHASWGGGDSAKQADAAVAEAKRAGKLVLLDFGAVWCPPCQAMAVEVLEAADRPDELDSYVVAFLDADDPSSFDWKSRYLIGGYPTVVLIKPDGTEVDRQVGYSGREDMVAWLAASADGEGLEAELVAGPEAVDPARAAEIAIMLKQQRRKVELEPWLERAQPVADSAAGHVLRLLTEATVADAVWMLDHAPERTGDWLFSAMDTLSEAEGGVEVMDRAVRAELRGADAERAADLLYVLANLHEDQAEAYYAGAAAALRPKLQGPPEQRKPHVGWMASLIERSGDVDGAVAFLDDAVATWPDEPTFHLSRGGMLLRAERHADAMAAADKAIETSWGDNRLRAAMLKVEVLLATDREDEAKALAKAELAAAAKVDDELKVRTFRYRKKLQAVIDGEE